jgi:hypothetical protein
MTPEKIQRILMQKRKSQEVIRALSKAKRDNDRREEEEQLKKKLKATAGARK